MRPVLWKCGLVSARRGSASLHRCRVQLGGPRRALVAALLAVAACSERDPRTLEQYVAEVEWFSAMRRQPSVEPYEEPARMPVPGTLPIEGVFPLPLAEAEKIKTNPNPPTPESLARGKTQYDVFCAVCHGPEGKGGGNVATATGFPAGLIPSLTTPRALALTDGYLYGMILNGRGLMPSYRRIPAEDRWHIVNYVRALQRTAQVATGARDNRGTGAR